MGMNHMYVAWCGIYILTKYCKMDKAGHVPDTDHHSLVSLSIVRNMKSLALIAGL